MVWLIPASYPLAASGNWQSSELYLYTYRPCNRSATQLILSYMQTNSKKWPGICWCYWCIADGYGCVGWFVKVLFIFRWLLFIAFVSFLVCLPINIRHHNGCKCAGAKYTPGHQHPSCWLDCENIDGLVQDCSISTADALELLQSFTKPSTWIISLRNVQMRCSHKQLTYKWNHEVPNPPASLINVGSFSRRNSGLCTHLAPKHNKNLKQQTM